MEDLFVEIENIILSHSRRGIDNIRHVLTEGYCGRAAHLIIDNPGTVVIGTGFPVKNSFETDGPVGAIALYRVLSKLGYRPVFVCAPPISRQLMKAYDTYEIPILDWEATRPFVTKALANLAPSLIISIERPGVTKDGRYYNMRGKDISNATAKFDQFFELSNCPTIAFGDGGNEVGMGKIGSAAANLPIRSSVTSCDELVIATVSNWGVYGVIAAMSRILKQDLFSTFDPQVIIAYLVDNGSVDGVTARPECSEDGFDLSVGLSVIEMLRGLLGRP